MMSWLRAVILTVLVPAIVAGGSAAQATVICVDGDATPGGDGSCWSSPFRYLQDALAAAESGDEIRVAAGTYWPDENEANPEGTGDRTATFHLVSGVGLYGGYAGYGAPVPDERDLEAYEVILSGDLEGDDGSYVENHDENSYHVVTGSGTNESAVIDGFTITAGYADGFAPHDRGGGMFNELGSPTLVDCTFLSNFTYGWDTDLITRGGGIYQAGGAPLLIRCVFDGNRAVGGWGTSGLGGGMYTRDGSTPTLIDCSFVQNSADGGFEGGLGAGNGLFSFGNSDVTLINCVFRGNGGGSYGGGMYSSGSSAFLVNCLFNDNYTYSWSDLDYGGGMGHSGAGELSLINCTFFNNWAERGGGLYAGSESAVTMRNCIFWQNSDTDGELESSQVQVLGGPLSVDHSCIQGLERFQLIRSALGAC